jgi:protein SCO1
MASPPGPGRSVRAAWRPLTSRLLPGLLMLALSCVTRAQAPAEHHQHAQAAAEATTRTEHAYFTPDVTLTDSEGKTAALRPLLESDQPVMLNFIYTSCTAICPMLTETFAQAQRELGADAAGLRMVSISIDPEYDTPKALKAYAQTYHAGPQWRFLTGRSADVAEVQRAFDAYRANKMDHAALVFLRASKGKPWIRFEGLVSPGVLVREVRAMHS